LKIAIMITQADEATPSDVYACWIYLHNSFMTSCKAATADYDVLDAAIRNEVIELLTARFDFMFHPTQLLAYALDPRFMRRSTVSGNEMSRFFHYFAKDFISESSVIDLISKIDEENDENTNEDDESEDLTERIATKMFEEFGNMGQHSIKREGIWKDSVIDSLTPLQWWRIWGRKDYPCLFHLAEKLFSLPASSAACERNLSTQDHIISKKRNKLGVSTSEKLIAIHWNLRRIARLEFSESNVNADEIKLWLRRSDDKVTSSKIAAALKDLNSHGRWKHPSYDDAIEILGYDFDSDTSFDIMHARDALDEKNEDSEEEDDDEGGASTLDEDREAFTSEEWEALPCPARVPQDVSENAPCAVFFGDPYYDWYVGTITEVQKRGKKKSITTPNLSVRFADGIANILASSENYGENKTWILLRKKSVELVVEGKDGTSEIEMEEDSEEDYSTHRPSKRSRRR
jgi:hypothetical protein